MDQIVGSSPSESTWNSKWATPHPGLPSAETATECRGYKIETRAIMGRHQPSSRSRGTTLGKQRSSVIWTRQALQPFLTLVLCLSEEERRIQQSTVNSQPSLITAMLSINQFSALSRSPFWIRYRLWIRGRLLWARRIRSRISPFSSCHKNGSLPCDTHASRCWPRRDRAPHPRPASP